MHAVPESCLDIRFCHDLPGDDMDDLLRQGLVNFGEVSSLIQAVRINTSGNIPARSEQLHRVRCHSDFRQPLLFSCK